MTGISAKKIIKILFFVLIFAAPLVFLLLNSAAFFYQQDEYYHFWFLNNSTLFDLFTKTEGVHFFPLTLLFKKAQYVFFGLSLYPRIVITYFLHLTGLLSVLYLLKTLKIYHRLFSPLLVILFLGINLTSSQAYLHMSTYDNTMPSIILMLWSLILFLKSEQQKKASLLSASLFLLFISLLFKEYSIVCLFLYIILVLKRNNFSLLEALKREKSTISGLLVLTIVFLLTTIAIQKINGDQAQLSGKMNLYIIIEMLFAYINIFIKSFWQITVPYGAFGDLLKTFSPKSVGDLNILYTSVNNFEFVLGFFTLIPLFIYLLRKKLIGDSKLIFAGIFYSVIIVPFTILTPMFSSSYLEGRYYYLIAIALIVLVSVIILPFLKQVKAQRLLIILLTFLILLNTHYYLSAFFESKNLSATKKKIIESITNDISNKQVGNNLILYVYGNNIGYYGIPDLMLPFQAGLGNMLAIHLFDKKYFITREYFKNKNTIKLWPINSNYNSGRVSQGVFDFSGKKFGFFFNYKDLKLYVRSNPHAIDDIQSFYWDDKKLEIREKTKEIRNKLRIETNTFALEKGKVMQHDLDLIDNKKYFLVDSLKKQNTYNLEGKEITVYMDGLGGYGGPYIHFTLPGDGSNEYKFNYQYDGYVLGFIARSPAVNGKYEQVKIFYEKDGIKIVFNNPIDKKSTLDFMFGLNGKTLIFTKNKPIEYLLETKNITINGNGKSVYKINTGNNVKLIRNIYVNENEGYITAYFVNGKFEKIKSTKGLDSKILEVELQSALKKGDTCIIPILALSEIEQNEKIFAEYKVDD